MKEEKIKNAIKAGIAITLLIITIIMVITIMLQYESEGEKNMPFKLSSIIVVSNAMIGNLILYKITIFIVQFQKTKITIKKR